MNHFRYLTAIVLVACATAVSAQAENSPSSGAWLISPSEAIEFKGEEGFNAPPAKRTRSLLPVIDIVRPITAADLKVKAPFAVEVQFNSTKDAPVNPATFKVLYGAFKVDITNRITQFVKVTASGFSLEDAQIPVGKHRLILQITDVQQRTSERDLRIQVE